MGGNKDKAKGRVKQAIGALTGDEELKKDGRREERTGQIKLKADEAIDVVRDKFDELVNKPASSTKEK